MEAKGCSFTNDTATIRIFVKALKNAHNLAAHIYEKDPQSLTDAITDVEKCNTAKQLTVTILPSSAVYMMSNDEDQCFKCQESEHKIQGTAFTSDVTNAMRVDISSWIALTRYLL